MRAAVFLGHRRIEVREIDDPSPKAGEVLLKVLACGVCGTDCGFVKNGLYDRWVACFFKRLILRIQIYLCKAKTDRKHTFSVLPPFCADIALMPWISIRRSWFLAFIWISRLMRLTPNWIDWRRLFLMLILGLISKQFYGG